LAIALMATSVTSFWIVLFALARQLLLTLGAVLLVIPGLAAMTRLSVGNVIIVVEGDNTWNGVWRSVGLTEGDCGYAVFGLLLLSGAVNFAVLIAARLAIGGEWTWSASPALGVNPIYVAAECAVGSLFAIFNAALAAAIYVELLHIKEGAE